MVRSQLKYVLTSGVLGSAADGLARLLDTSVVVPLLEALRLLLLLVLAITELKQEGMVHFGKRDHLTEVLVMVKGKGRRTLHLVRQLSFRIISGQFDFLRLLTSLCQLIIECENSS